MSELTTTNATDSSPARILPDVAICRVKPIGTIAGFAHCLVDRPMECKYVLYFGEGNICRHSCWKDFIVRATRF